VAEATTKLSELKYFETQADHSGGISCFMAGYDIRGMGESLLRKIYKDYNLPSEAAKYPSLETRILLTKQNDSIVGKLITVYEAGNYAIMAAEYAESVKCFEYVLNKGFKSREIYNNLGVCALFRVMDLLGSETVKYVYPVEIDVESRLKGTHKGFSEETKGLLKKAKDYLSIAVQLDKNYSSAHINLACVNSLEGAIEEGKYNASQALKILTAGSKDPSYAMNATIIMAILLDQENKTGEAKSLLTEAIKISPNYLAEVNLEIIKGKKAQDFVWTKKLSKDKFRNEAARQITIEAKPETIEGVTDFLKNLEGKELNEIEMNNGSCYYLPYNNSEIYNLTTDDEHELYFQETGKNYTGQTSKGIKLQNNLSDVLHAYGLPDATYASKGENMLVYRDAHLIIKLKNAFVSSWAIYKRY
jgi:tetratricopeptide (TPR) repeat protein